MAEALARVSGGGTDITCVAIAGPSSHCLDLPVWQPSDCSSGGSANAK